MFSRSEDDPFILYATMYSGLHANFVTRDLFRSEKYRLHSEKHAELFKRWQQAHQINISYVSPSGRVYAKVSLPKYLLIAANDDHLISKHISFFM